MKLNLGCGKVRLPGYVNVDLYAPADRRDDIRTLGMFADESVDEILADHVLEHFGMAEVDAVLRAWFRVLKAGGTARINVPDLPSVLSAWVCAHERNEPILYLTKAIFGNQSGPGEFHKWGFWEASLREHLERGGFAGIEMARVWSHGVVSLSALARKA